jgi:hypothetical protein
LVDSELAIRAEGDDREPRNYAISWERARWLGHVLLIGAHTELEAWLGAATVALFVLFRFGDVEVIAAFVWSEIELRKKTLDPETWDNTAELVVTAQLVFLRDMDVGFDEEALIGLEAFSLHNELLVDLWNELAVKLLDGDLVRRFAHSVAFDGGVILPPLVIFR